jgi:acetoin utilization deacetylase AcuC-like enzyme
MRIVMPLYKIPIFYTPAMSIYVESSSPSASKPTQVVEAWRETSIPLEIIEPEPLTLETLSLAHDPDYVNGIFSGTIKNGFGNKRLSLAESLRFTCGAMLSAAQDAIKNGMVAVAPCSGFHHAGFADAFGYCTFNGLMITACALKKERTVNRVGILDFDMHDGDGTQAIIDHLQAKDWITHYSAGREYLHHSQAQEFLNRIDGYVEEMKGCDVILYQAGADPHIDDPLGGWLTTDQLAERDRLVFSAARRLGVPIAWNLAGGYQVDADGGINKIIQIHNNTLIECAKVFLA